MTRLSRLSQQMFRTSNYCATPGCLNKRQLGFTRYGSPYTLCHVSCSPSLRGGDKTLPLCQTEGCTYRVMANACYVGKKCINCHNMGFVPPRFHSLQGVPLCTFRHCQNVRMTGKDQSGKFYKTCSDHVPPRCREHNCQNPRMDGKDHNGEFYKFCSAHAVPRCEAQNCRNSRITGKDRTGEFHKFCSNHHMPPRCRAHNCQNLRMTGKDQNGNFHNFCYDHLFIWGCDSDM